MFLTFMAWKKSQSERGIFIGSNNINIQEIRETLLERLLSDMEQVPSVETYSDDVSCCVLAVCLVVLLRRVRLLQSL